MAHRLVHGLGRKQPSKIRDENLSVPNFPDYLNTGHSEAIIKDLLDKTIKYLVTQYHFKNIKVMRDRVGHFANVMRDPHSQRFYLLAKGSELYLDIISCQAYLPNAAAQEQSPLILMWRNPKTKDAKFYLFDPQSILDQVREDPEHYGYNDRQGVRMVNFSIHLGEPYEPEMSVEAAWKRAKERKCG